MKFSDYSSVAALALSFGMVAVEGHSFLVCTQKVGSECKGYPRNFENFGLHGDGYTYRPPSRNEVAGAKPCDPQKQAFGANYQKFPMAVAPAGGKITLEWPARNHAPANLPGRTNEIYMWNQKNPSKDVAGSDLVLIDTIPYGDLSDGTSVCGTGSPNDRLCRGEVTIPSNLQDGIYTFQWFWEFNSGEYYSTCFEVNVGGVAPSEAPTTPAPTSGNGDPVVTPTPTESNQGVDCTVKYSVVWESGSQFGAYLQVDCSITLTNWNIDFTFPSGQSITNIWNAQSNPNGNAIRLTPQSYNKSGKTFSIGFNANKGSANSPPTTFVVTHEGGSVGSRSSIVEADENTPNEQPMDFVPSTASSLVSFGAVGLISALVSFLNFK